MQENPSFHRDRLTRQGSAMVTVMLVVVVTMMATASLFAFSSSTVHRVRLLTEAIRAKAIAEAGINGGYVALRQDRSRRTSGILYSDAAFGEGAYTVTTERRNGGWSRMVSVGSFGRAEHQIGLDVRMDSDRDAEGTNDVADIADFLKYAIFCNGSFQINGTPKNINGDLHANGSFGLSGNWDNVYGTVAAPPPNSIPDANRADWTHIHFPQPSEKSFQDFLTEAAAAGIPVTQLSGNQVYKKDQTFNGITVIHGSVTFQGSGNRVINGLFYVSGSMTVNGSTTLSGAMLVGGALTINGASAILAYNADAIGAGDDGEEAVAEDGDFKEIWWD